MKKKELDNISDSLCVLNSNKFNLYKGYGFSTLQIKELFEYEEFNVLYVIRSRYIIPDMSVAQIREIMRGIYSDHILSMDVQVYANVKYSHGFMRTIRILLERGIDASMIRKLLGMGEFTSKEIFVLALAALVDNQDIELNVRFVKKCKDQVDQLYKAYSVTVRSKKYSLEDITKSFDLDLNLAKIEYLESHKNESI